MHNIRKWLGIGAIGLSLLTLMMAAIGFGVFGALENLVGALVPSNNPDAPRYNIGAGIMFFYAAGIALGITALTRTVAAAIIMLPLGACTFLLGGAIAQAYGITIATIGVLLLINEAVAAKRHAGDASARPAAPITDSTPPSH